MKSSLAYLQAAESPAPGPGCWAELHVGGGRMRFLSDLALLPGREASDPREYDTPQSLGLKLDSGKPLFHSSHLVVTVKLCRISIQPSQTFQCELEDSLVTLNCGFMERSPTPAVGLGKLVSLLDTQILQQRLITCRWVQNTLQLTFTSITACLP